MFSRNGNVHAKLDFKHAYCIVPICEDHQSLLKFQCQTFLFKFTALPIGHTEGSRKFTKILKPPLAFLTKIEKILNVGYFDYLIAKDNTISSCCGKISEISLRLSKPGFVTHREITLSTLVRKLHISPL